MSEHVVPYVDGPMAGGYTELPSEAVRLDGAYEECPIPPGYERGERYILRLVGGSWGFYHAGPVEQI